MIGVLEFAGVALGLLYLLLAIREQRLCWIAGGLASVLFGVVFWDAELPMQALLQVYYGAIAIHGWMHWGSRAGHSSPVPHRISGISHGTIIIAVAIASVVSVYLRNEAGSLQAWVDSISSWGGVVATWMVARKVLESWLYWIFIDLLTAGLYLQVGLLASSGLYLAYTILAAIAWKEWLTHYRQSSET